MFNQRNIFMEIKKHYITGQNYEGKNLLITKPQSLDMIIFDYYKDIKFENVLGQKWTACKDMLTLIIELNPHILLKTTTAATAVKEGSLLFMPNPILQSTDGQIKLWD